MHLIKEASDWASSRWVFRAIVYKKNRTTKFVGYGDADPSNVSSIVSGSELRITETRAVNRALRKAYGIGICSVEELGSSPSTDPAPKAAQENHQQHHNGSNNGQPRLRDQPGSSFRNKAPRAFTMTSPIALNWITPFGK